MAVRFLPCVLMAVVVVAAGTGRTAFGQPLIVHNVLTIHAGGVDFPANPIIDAGIRETLLSGQEDPVNYFTEYLEGDRFTSPEASRALGDYIARKYGGMRFDLVIAITNRSLEFVLDHQASLFPSAAIVGVAIGVSDTDLVRRSRRRLTGVRVGNAFIETAQLALQLHPGTRNLFVIATSPNETNERSVRAELSRVDARVSVRYLTADTVEDLLAAVRRVPPRSVILYIWFQKSGDDYLADPARTARLVAQAARVPVYGAVDSVMGTGVIGGMLRETRGTGTTAGAMARRILDGTPPRSIPFVYAPLRPVFDWQQLRRWGIDAARLPAGSDFRFKEPTAWERYGRYLAAAGLLMAVQLSLIAGLLTQRSNRRRAELALRGREQTLRKSLRRIRRMAGHLINAQETVRTEIARELHDDICQGLAAISMMVSGLKRSVKLAQDVKASQSVSQLEKAVLDTLEGVRRVSHDLHPASLRLVGLVVALRGHCVEIEKRHGVQVTLRARGDFGDVPPEIAVCLFRIVQESLRNGISHGKARRLAVSVARRDTIIDLVVTDDGCGFDLAAAQRGGRGLGLISIEERAHVVGGRAQILTERNGGTTIHVRVPIATQPGKARDDSQARLPVPHSAASVDVVRRALGSLRPELARPAAGVPPPRWLMTMTPAQSAAVGDAALHDQRALPSPASAEQP